MTTKRTRSVSFARWLAQARVCKAGRKFVGRQTLAQAWAKAAVRMFCAQAP